jgi:hypothetical protein
VLVTGPGSRRIGDETFLLLPIRHGAGPYWTRAGSGSRLWKLRRTKREAKRPRASVDPWQFLDVAYLPTRNSDSPPGFSSEVFQYIVQNVREWTDLDDLFT